MSDTPRTKKLCDDITWGECDNPVKSLGMLSAKLEREADKLAKQCVKNVEEIGTLRAALEAETKRRLGAEACLKSWKEDEGADAARFAWLLDNVNLFKKLDVGGKIIDWCRCDIDEEMAMEAQNDER